MKATGIVRRIDDLGRVVIPKEIRRTLRIREGDPLEIFTDREGGIILKKYSPIGELNDYARDFTASMGAVLECTVAVCDKDSVVSAHGSHKKDYLARPVGKQLEQLIEERGKHKRLSADAVALPVYDGEDVSDIACQIIEPIISEGQAIGAVILISKEGEPAFTAAEEKAALMAVSFIGSQMAT